MERGAEEGESDRQEMEQRMSRVHFCGQMYAAILAIAWQLLQAFVCTCKWCCKAPQPCHGTLLYG